MTLLPVMSVGRKDDLRDAKAEKETLRRSIAETKGISSDSLASLSLPELRRLSDDTNGGGDPKPDPKSGDVQPDETVSRSDRSEYEQLKETREFLESKTGKLAEARLETVNERIREIESLKGR